MTAQRNAFYYVLDRETGEFLTGQPFAKQTWAKGLDAKGRPIVLPNTEPTPGGNYVCPDAAGSANWGSPSYDAAHQPVYRLSARSLRHVFERYERRSSWRRLHWRRTELDPKIGTPGAVRALDALTGATKWNFPLQVGSSATGVWLRLEEWCLHRLTTET